MKAVGYVRLSKEEDNNDESTSITNQKHAISKYADANNLFITDWYVDDGFSGYSFDRPDFNRLKQDMKDNKIKVIIAKDLSRIGRRNSKCLLFLEDAVESRIRVIAINDNYDSNSDSGELIGIKTWHNEFFVKDTSRKVRATAKVLQSEGRLITSVPFGYHLDPIVKCKILLDDYSAMYVKRIFDMYIDGNGFKKIAETLTEENVPTPTMYEKMYKERIGIISDSKVAKYWSAMAVKKILKNEFYTGDLAQGKTFRNGIKGKKIVNEKEDVLIFEDHHEAIIDRDTFDLTQKIMEKRSIDNTYRGKSKYEFLFNGLMYCADCGKKMICKTPTKSDVSRYTCSNYHTYGKSVCSTHSVTEESLIILLKKYLITCKNELKDILLNIDIQLSKAKRDVSDNDILLRNLEKQVDTNKEELKIMLEQKIRDSMKNPEMIEIIDATYAELIDEKSRKIVSLIMQYDNIKSVNKNNDEIKDDIRNAYQMLCEIISEGSFNRRQIEILVKKIYVHEDKTVDIYLNGNIHELIGNNKKLIVRYSGTVDILFNYFFNEIDPDEDIRKMKTIELMVERGLIVSDSVKSREAFDLFVEKGILSKPINKQKPYKLLVNKEEAIALLEGYLCTENSYDDNDNDIYPPGQGFIEVIRVKLAGKVREALIREIVTS